MRSSATPAVKAPKRDSTPGNSRPAARARSVPERHERSQVFRGLEWRYLLELAVRMIVSDRKFDRGTSLDLQDLPVGFDLGLVVWVGFFWVGFFWGRFSATFTTSIGQASYVVTRLEADRPPWATTNSNKLFRLGQHPPEKRTPSRAFLDARRYRCWPFTVDPASGVGTSPSGRTRSGSPRGSGKRKPLRPVSSSKNCVRDFRLFRPCVTNVGRASPSRPLGFEPQPRGGSDA